MSTEDRNNGEPMAKRVRGLLDYENPEDDKLIQSAEVVQVEIERIIEQETREVSRVQNMYAQKRLEVYARRRKFLEMLLESPVSEFLNEDDVHVMKYLTDLEFIEAENPTISFHFAPNPFFSNDVIIKSFRFVEDGLESQAFHIDWAPGKNITDSTRRCTTGQCGKGPGKRRQERDERESFFLWFDNEASFDENQMVDDLRNIFQHPFAFIGQEPEPEQGEEQGGDENAVPAEERRAEGEEDENEDDDDEGELYVESDATETGMPAGKEVVEEDENNDEEGDADGNGDFEDEDGN